MMAEGGSPTLAHQASRSYSPDRWWWPTFRFSLCKASMTVGAYGLLGGGQFLERRLGVSEAGEAGR